MSPGRTIIDLVGLNERSIAHNGFSADSLFAHYQPDLIYLPHPSYVEIIERIESNPYFISHYEYYPSSDLMARMSVAIRKDSKYYPELHEIMTAGLPVERR